MIDDNPYAAPEYSTSSHGQYSDDGSGLSDGADCWQDDGLLIMRKEAILPDRCIKCNRPANNYRLKRKLSWHPPVWFLTVLISPLLYLIVALCVRYTARIEDGLCDQHRIRRARAIVWAWVAILGGITLMGIGSTLIDSDWFPLPILGGLVMILSGIIVGVVGAQVATTKSIDEHHVWLAKVDPEYLRMLPAWLD